MELFCSPPGGREIAESRFLKNSLAAWGQTVTAMIGNLPKGISQPSDELVHAARILDKYYLPTRYPNGSDSGAPTDDFKKEEALSGIGHAEALLEFCRL